MEVTVGEISAVIRLVREVCDRWDDPQVWREHLLQGACTLLDGNVSTMFCVGAPMRQANWGQFIQLRLSAYLHPSLRRWFILPPTVFPIARSKKHQRTFYLDRQSSGQSLMSVAGSPPRVIS